VLFSGYATTSSIIKNSFGYYYLPFKMDVRESHTDGSMELATPAGPESIDKVIFHCSDFQPVQHISVQRISICI
jgi:hypothetical protein